MFPKKVLKLIIRQKIIKLDIPIRICTKKKFYLLTTILYRNAFETLVY